MVTISAEISSRLRDDRASRHPALRQHEFYKILLLYIIFDLAQILKEIAGSIEIGLQIFMSVTEKNQTKTVTSSIHQERYSMTSGLSSNNQQTSHIIT